MLNNRCIIYTLFALLICSCEDFVEIDSPSFQLTAEQVFNDQSSADGAVREMYRYYMSALGGRADGPAMHYSTLQSDELLDFANNVSYIPIENYEILSEDFIVDLSWAAFYALIYRANAVIEGVSNKDYAKKGQFDGEARFLRAWTYFKLINLFGNVPLVTSTSVDENIYLPRTDSQAIYELIISDLEIAFTNVPEDYLHAEGEKIRVNKWAVAALLARVYLYQRDWTAAESYASMVINSTKFNLVDISTTPIFSKNNGEAILQFSPEVRYGMGTYRVSYFYPYTILGASLRFPIDPVLVAKFDDNDLRKANWFHRVVTGNLTFYEPYKFKEYLSTNTSEAVTTLRLGEQFLIRAEARAELGDLIGAQADLNVIRSRAALAATSATTQTELRLAIEDERYRELHTEEFHRWFDLKRTGRAEAILGRHIGFDPAVDLLWPIPAMEMGRNPNLTQNPGY